MSIVAVIPARGGSIGIPGKNIRNFNGVPLIGHTIKAARQSKIISEVYVSSDASNIRTIASQYGASTIIRPDEISGSLASSESALLHAIDYLREASEIQPKYIVFLQCTSPFTTAEQIDEVLEALLEQNADSAFSAIEDHSFIWEVNVDGLAYGVTHDQALPRQRRQDLKPRYRENGAIYAMRTTAFMENQSRFCGKCILVPTNMPPVEIDTEDDWIVAENIARHLDRKNWVAPKRIRAVVTDFDGVHTDNRVTLDDQGKEWVTCSRSDGMGIEALKSRQVHALILSKETNPVVLARAAKLKINVIHQTDHKLPKLDAWRREKKLDWSEIAYIGNDENDIECMTSCGLSFCPADAHTSARQAASVILSNRGGNGAIREMVDFLIENKLLP